MCTPFASGRSCNLSSSASRPLTLPPNRVVGQSSEKLLSLLDQSLASWFLALPPHLAFNISSKRSVPPPHVLCLHLQFYSALILLHRPFIPGSSARSDEACFPSHAICTTAANAIAHIVAVFSQTFSLRQCPPFLTYPLFSAGIICVFNIGFDESLAGPAKSNLRVLMNALRVSLVINLFAYGLVAHLFPVCDRISLSLGRELHASTNYWTVWSI